MDFGHPSINMAAGLFLAAISSRVPALYWRSVSAKCYLGLIVISHILLSSCAVAEEHDMFRHVASFARKSRQIAVIY